MSWADDRVFLDHPDDIHLYDTSEPENGAPGKPGEIRIAVAELESGQKVLQRRRLFLISGSSSIVKGSVLEKGLGAAYTADALAPADTAKMQLAGVVPYGVNRNLKGGVAAGTIPLTASNDYWAWLVVEGIVDVLADANIANEALLITKAASAAGRVDDPAVSTLEHCIMGRALEAVTGGAGTLFEAEVSIA